MQALMIGCGNMGGALLTRWIAHERNEWTIAEPSDRGLPDGVRHVRGPQEIADERFDMIIVAVKPQMIDQVAGDYAGLLRKGGVVVSIAAGFSAAALAKAFGAEKIVRLMPNTPARLGRGVIGLYGAASITPEDKQQVEALAEAAGSYLWLDHEDHLDRLTAIAGSGPGYVFEIAQAYVNAAESLGFPEQTARELVLLTMSGAIEMARQSKRPITELRDEVTSAKGTTAAGLEALNRNGLLHGLLENAARSAYARAVELR